MQEGWLILADDWVSIDDAVDFCITSISSHSIRITDACTCACDCTCSEMSGDCPDVVIKKTYEKMGSGPKYSITYDCPDGDGTGSNLYDEE